VDKQPVGLHIQQLEAVGLEAVDDIRLHLLGIKDRDPDDELWDLEEAVGPLEGGVVGDAFMTLLEDVVVDLHAFQGLFVDRGIQVFHIEL